MVQRTGAQVTLLEIAPGISKDFKTMADFIKENKDLLNRFHSTTNPLTAQEQIDISNKIKADIAGLNSRVYVAADVASCVSGPHFMGLPVHAGFGAFVVVSDDAKAEFKFAAVASRSVRRT